MAVLPLNLARVSNLMRGDLVASQVARTQEQLARVQNELATGKKLNRPSDDPGDAAAASQLQKVLEQRKAFADNLTAASSNLSEVDGTLGDLTELLRQAQEIASANVGSDVTADARKSAAAVIQSIYQQAVSLGNKQFNGTYLFGGDKATDPPFETIDGGVRFVGSATTLANQMDHTSSLSFMVDGAAVFGATSTRVTGTADLTPGLTADTQIADLRGATNKGVRLGAIVLGNGTTTKIVDLTEAKSAGDVVNAINAAGVGSVTASVGATGNLILTGGAGDNITVTDLTNGTTASDLGIHRNVGAGAGAPLNGSAVQPKITELTPLSELNGGAGVDLSGGLTITNGSQTATVTFTTPPLRAGATVGDMLNAINGSGANVQARVNASGTGIDIINPNQGVRMTIGEAGGTTAADLGVRSFAGTTTLAELNNGKGVQNVTGPDFRITRTDGSTFDVDINGASTIQDVITAINTAGGPTVTASLAATGNGLVLTDTAGGVGTLSIAPLNFSDAYKDLGLDVAAVGTAINGRDVNPIAAQGVFANLAALRDALENSDQAGITTAASGLQEDESRVVRMRGQTGARVQELESRKDRLDEQNVATEALLSELQDTNFTEAITRFEALQTALQATMAAGSKTLSLSLMDFLG